MNEALRDCLSRFETVNAIVKHASSRALSDGSGSYIRSIQFSVGEKVKDRRRFVAESFDVIQKKIFEQAFVDLVATFERIVFQRLDNASGEMKKILIQAYKRPAAFSVAVGDFVKGSEEIDSLNQLRKLLGTRMPPQMSERFGEIIAYRHRVAHGKRFGSETILSMPEAARILDEVVDFICS